MQFFCQAFKKGYVSKTEKLSKNGTLFQDANGCLCMQYMTNVSEKVNINKILRLNY